MKADPPPIHALIVVDLQNDFIDGALAVPDARAVLPVVKRLLDRFDLLVFTKDWHPAAHGSFAVNHPGKALFEQIDLNGFPQTLWPVHCVQGTHGAELAEGLPVAGAHRVHIVHKGTDPAIDSYSGFADNGGRKSTGLREFLENSRVDQVFVCGLATDYCVKATAIDSVRNGFSTWLIEDACRGVERHPGDIERSIQEMKEAGVQVVKSRAV